MRVALPLLGTMLVATISPVSADQYEQGPYVGISAGYLGISDNDGTIDVEYENGFDIGLQLGWKQWVWRLEAEFEYGESGFDSLNGFDVDGDFDALRWTGSLYYDFDGILTKFIPYFGGGLGIAYIDVKDVTVGNLEFEGDDDTYFTAHAEAGASIEINPVFAIVPAYRFIYFDTGGNGADDDTAHLLKLGIRYKF